MSTSCSYGGLNPDISGIGVRISYYLQTLFLGATAAAKTVAGCLLRSGSLDEISGALYTLMATNIAMAVAGLILGLKPAPEISFQDAVVILYLLSMGWTTVLVSLAVCNRFSDSEPEESTKILQLVSVIQSGVVGAFAPDCNGEAHAVIFRPLSALKSGRILGWVVTVLVTVAYTVMTGRDILAQFKRFKNKEMEPSEEGTQYASFSWKNPSPGILKPDPTVSAPPDIRSERSHDTDHGTATVRVDGRLLVELVFITVFWTFFVLNTELVIHWNHRTSADSGPNWGFGQILPVLLTLLPFINMTNAFKDFGMRRTRRVNRLRKVAVICD
ncbi:hypothetical protein MSAN_01152300 [Mycena sanguinolenta]|uniref:Uncharacterized protein n=1 Tax=Mycena sanguinolenta TaxID=230812 RepID=A0A8H6YLE3_9AGAR|nr:hypothetical protein MSAN_01152300 [Mycena sanguinolenta]